MDLLTSNTEIFIERLQLISVEQSLKLAITVWKASKYGVFSYIRTEYRKIRTNKNSVFGYFSLSEYAEQDILVKLRSSCSQMFFKIGVFKNFTNFTNKHLCWSIFLAKLQTSKPQGLKKSQCNQIITSNMF